MFDFSQLEHTDSKTKYWYIEHVETGKPVYLPFKRDFEKQTYRLYEKNKENIDNCSYWVEDTVYKLLNKMVSDNNLNRQDFKIVCYEE